MTKRPALSLTRNEHRSNESLSALLVAQKPLESIHDNFGTEHAIEPEETVQPLCP
jgi:hypothetical protein